MNKRILIIGTVIVVLTLLVGPLGLAGAKPAMDLEDDIEASIQKGLDWLVPLQNGKGSRGSYCYVAHTGLVVLKLETRAHELGYDPLSADYEYSDEISAGLAYILSQRHDAAVGVGEPDGNGNGNRVGFYQCSTVYETGIAMMAIAASGHPETYETDLQDAVDWMAWAQADPTCGVHRGGWRYAPNACDSDNSNSGYATLGLGFAQAPAPFGFGLTVPPSVKDELSIWIGVIQDPVSGGSYYDPEFPGWVNILKTGNLLYEMGLTGDDASTPRVMDAVHYIEQHWTDPGVCDTGWVDHRQAMFTMMKGLESLGIEELDLDAVPGPETVWFDEVAQHLILTQNVDGSWPADCWGGPILSTAWALLTLEKTVPVFEIPVPFDVHPGSCPNPFNVDKKGVTPVAIAGTMDLDVYTIDPDSLKLQASLEDGAAFVSPLRWAYEDAAQPFEPYQEKELDRYFCIEYEEGDGYMDLTAKFDSQEVAGALLGGVADGDVVKLFITGNLKEEFGGAPIVGEDVIWILTKK